MEDLIMNEFEKTNSKPSHIIMLRNLRNGLFRNLNPKEVDAAYAAINSLIDKQYINYEKNSDILRLTELGYAQLYKNSKSIEQIAQLILKAFERQSSKAGDMIMMNNISHNLLQKLNPVEQDIFNDSINKLINDGLITYEDSHLACLRLTEKGYEGLYN